MGIFNRSKLKVRSESVDDDITYYINYHNYKASDIFMSDLINKMSEGENFLVVIDTKMITRTTKDTGDVLSKLMAILEKLDLKYKVLKVPRDNRITLFGASVNINDKKKSMDTIIGTIVNIENIKVIKEMLNDYFIYYYIKPNMTCTHDEILDNFEKNYNNDTLKDFFKFNILDSKFLQQLVISAKKDNSEYILGVIGDLTR